MFQEQLVSPDPADRWTDWQQRRDPYVFFFFWFCRWRKNSQNTKNSIFVLQNFHYYWYFIKISTHLSWWIKVFIHTDFDLVKEYWVEGWIEFMAHQFFHVFLDLRSKFLVLTNQQLQQVTDKPEVRSIRDQYYLQC